MASSAVKAPPPEMSAIQAEGVNACDSVVEDRGGCDDSSTSTYVWGNIYIYIYNIYILLIYNIFLYYTFIFDNFKV